MSLPCLICLKKFDNPFHLQQHQLQNKNCLYKCVVCLKNYATASNLNRHDGNGGCKQRYECNTCCKIYKSKYSLLYHTCQEMLPTQPPCKTDDVIPLLQPYLLPNIPEPKQIHIHITNYNNQITNTNTNTNSNSINNSTKTINKLSKKINFMNTKPYLFENDRYEEGKHNELQKYNEVFDEQMTDMYLYEEQDFKAKYKESIVHYEKKTLELVGFKMLHTELQKDPKHQNVQIKKSKSGKCFIYNGKWVEVPLQKTITKICSKLCDSLYDKNTSVHQFIRLMILSQPNRMSDLRKLIETNILNLQNLPLLKGPD